VKKLELELKMAPVPLKCPVAECVYKTPASLPNYDTVYKDLDLHTRYFHHDLQVAQPIQQQTGAGNAGLPKPDRLPRPTIGEGSTDSDWVYFIRPVGEVQALNQT
jgi:hypothetical protein